MSDLFFALFVLLHHVAPLPGAERLPLLPAPVVRQVLARGVRANDAAAFRHEVGTAEAAPVTGLGGADLLQGLVALPAKYVHD